MTKVLILDCSPKRNGNTAKVKDLFVENLGSDVETETIKLFPNINGEGGILPCVDCGACKKVDHCVIEDDFQKITKDDYDTVVLFAPLYMSNLPGPAFNLSSRFQYLFNNEWEMNLKHEFKQKRGIVVILGGGHSCKHLMGKTNADMAVRHAKFLFKKVGASLEEEDVLTCLNTDDCLPLDNPDFVKNIVCVAESVCGNKADETQKA